MKKKKGNRKVMYSLVVAYLGKWDRQVGEGGFLHLLKTCGKGCLLVAALGAFWYSAHAVCAICKSTEPFQSNI